jgi:hypothetical protein
MRADASRGANFAALGLLVMIEIIIAILAIFVIVWVIWGLIYFIRELSRGG